MNMNGIYAQDAQINQKVEKKAPQNSPPSEYKVGQELEGIILKVSEQISINFSGREVSVSQSTIPNAREGEIRKFQITEISNTGIVLKEVGSTTKQQDIPGTNGIVFTQTEVDPSAVLTSSEKEEDEKAKELDEISSKMTAKNYEDIENEGISLKSYNLNLLTRALERVKVQRSIKNENNREQSEQLKQEVEQARKLAISFLPDSAVAQKIAESLVNADLPITQDNVINVANAMELSSVALQLGNASAAYLIKNELEPSIENIYKAVHSGEANHLINKEVEFDEIKDLVKQMIIEAEFEDEAVAMKEAKWLFQSNLNITKENILYKMELEELPKNLSLDDVARKATQCLANGQKATDGLLLLRSKIKMEETRLKLSYEAQGNMSKKGIQVDTETVKEQVENLKQLEHKFYKSYLGETEQNVSDKIERIEQTVATMENLKQTSAFVLGLTFEQRHEITLNQLSKTAVTNGENYKKAELSYEALMTVPRKDMGDSIQKAFQNVDSQLELLGLEKTEVNQRAVKILAYNQIELTTENITGMKAYDAKVNYLLEHMTPTVTTTMVKEGINPLNIPIDELNQITRDYQERLGDSKEVKFSEYLVGLENNEEISKEQRDAYVGIYRLLHQVEASDGAVIGAVVKAGKELTLNALLTEVRTSKKGGVNLLVNEHQGTVESRGGYSNSITDTINANYSEQSGYQQSVVSATLQEMDANVLDQVATKYGDQLYDISLEQLQQELRETNILTSINQAEKKLELLQKLTREGGSYLSFLDDYQLTDNIQNIVAAKNMIENNPRLYEKTEKVLNETKSLRQYSKELVHQLNHSIEFNTAYESMQQEVVGQLKEEVFAESNQEITSGIVNDIIAICDIFSINQQLQQKEFYNIPMEVRDSLVNVNLTVVHNTEEKGKVRINIPTNSLGNISVEAAVEQGRIRCLITSNMPSALQKLKSEAINLTSKMEELGYSVIQQHYSYETRSQEQFIFASGSIYKDSQKNEEKKAMLEPQESKTNTDELYQVAKQLITHLTDIA